MVNRSPRLWPSIVAANCSGYGASSHRPRNRIARPVAGATIPRPALSCCGWRKVERMLRRHRCGARWPLGPIVWRARDCFRPSSNSCSKREVSTRRATLAWNWKRSPTALLQCVARGGVAGARIGVPADAAPEAALSPFRKACEFWRQAEAPYLTARARALMGLACRTLGDEDGARLELEAARVVFQELGAISDFARVSSYLALSAGKAHRLTKRESQVLQLVRQARRTRRSPPSYS